MDSQIALSVGEDELERETEDALSFQDTITDCKFKIMQVLKMKQQENPVSSFHNRNSIGKAAASRIHVNLPKISIKSFNGDQLEWLTFWDSFSAAIDENIELNDVEKMNYLLGMLKGEAARAIAGLPLTKENYSKAIEILKERFGDKQNLINAYMESLSRAYAPSSETTSLRIFYDTCEANIRGLEALGVTTDSYGSLLIPILLKKLPESIRCAIFRADQSADKSLDKLRTTLRKEIETKEKGHLSSMNDHKAHEEEPLVPTAGAMLSRTQQRAQNPKPRIKPRNCTFCDGNHRSDKCNKVITIQERYQSLQRQQRCFNCLGVNHIRAKCFSKGRCMKCKKKHHTSICDETLQDTSNETTSQHASNAKYENADQNDKPSSEGKKTHMGATQTASHPKGEILMQTATAKATGDGVRELQARILFDTGSQRTFISEDMRNKLNLKAIRQELLDVTTFGTLKSNRRKYDVVTFTLHAEKENLRITALATPIICPPLSIKMKNFEIPPELKGLKLADKTNGNLEVDIVIGNDQFGQLITGKMIKTSNEAIIAMESKFGWLLSGPTSSNCNRDTTRCQRADIQMVDTKLDNILTKFWEINQIPQENETDSSVIKTFEETIQFNAATGRYNVKLPWKKNKNDLPSNFNLSMKRLISLQRSLYKKDPELIKKYDSQLLEQLHLGFIEKVSDLNHHEGTLHYIPHFPVFKADSATTKMRIVYDASAKLTATSPSLNDCLHTGANLMQDLTGILIRFRKHNVAFTADIEKAFLQIELHTNVRDATRFLWLKDINKSASDPKTTCKHTDSAASCSEQRHHRFY
ncbi:hypothetical protein QZH41_006187 [Actinostola sp. cb2023]|nr:hypothetical protein QZH41_006187 [Actinostola sp. cb2023]